MTESSNGEIVGDMKDGAESTIMPQIEQMNQPVTFAIQGFDPVVLFGYKPQNKKS